MVDFELKYPYMQLNQEWIDRLEKGLKEQFDYPPLPEDYKQFLLKHNGGFVSPGYVDDGLHFESEHTHEVVLDTTLKMAKADNKPFISAVVSFFGVYLDGMPFDGKNEGVHEYFEYLPDIIASNEHSKNDFNVLPDRMMSFASCQCPDVDDLLAMSLNNEDYGAIYYYYGMHHFPSNFMGSVYLDKMDAIVDRHKLNIPPFADGVSFNQKMNQIMRAAKRLQDEERINFERGMVPFIKVADSFTDLLSKLYIVENENRLEE